MAEWWMGAFKNGDMDCLEKAGLEHSKQGLGAPNPTLLIKPSFEMSFKPIAKSEIHSPLYFQTHQSAWRARFG